MRKSMIQSPQVPMRGPSVSVNLLYEFFSQPIIWIVFWLMLGLLILSPIGIYVFTIRDTFFFELPAVLLLAIAVATGAPVFSWLLELAKNPVYAASIVILAVLGFIGYFFHGSVKAVGSDVRNIAVALATVIILFGPALRTYAAPRLAASVSISAILASVVTLVMVRLGFGGSEGAEKTALPIFLPAIAVVISAYYLNVAIYFFSTALMFGMAYLALYRSLLAFAIIVFIYSLYVLFVTGVRTRAGRLPGNMRVKLIVVLVAMFSVFVARLTIWQKVQMQWSASSEAKGHLIDKTENVLAALRGERELNASDMQRVDYVMHAVSSPGFYVLPKGLGSRESIEGLASIFPSTIAPASTRDSFYYFWLYHGGWVMLFLIAGTTCVFVVKDIRGLPLYLKVNRLMVLGVCSVYFAFTAEMIIVIPKGVGFAFFLFGAWAVPEKEWRGLVPLRRGIALGARK